MKHLYIRGFTDGREIQYRFYDNSTDFEENWDMGIGIYRGLKNCCNAIFDMHDRIQLIGFDIPEVDIDKIKFFRKYLEKAIEEHNSALVS